MSDSQTASKAPLRITVKAGNPAIERRWAAEIARSLEEQNEFEAGCESAAQSSEPAPGQIVLIDASMPSVDAYLAGLDRTGRAVFLVVSEDMSRPPEAWLAGEVDDVLIHPFHPLEVFGKLRHHRQVLMWEEVRGLNAKFGELVGQLQGDLQLAERLQKARQPQRFPDVKGFGISSRYLAGMKSGGDHFDLAEAANGHQISLVLSDSSSYGLSSAVLLILMRVTLKLSAEESRSCTETVRRIREELVLTLSEKDQLSLFYGVISRKDYRLRYLNLGTSEAFYADPGEEFRVLPSQGSAIRRAAAEGTAAALGSGAAEQEIVLQPEGRLVLVSDGFLDAVGGAEAMRKLLSEGRAQERADVLNELVYRVKSAFAEPDDLPAQDCSVAIFDVGARVIRAV